MLVSGVSERVLQRVYPRGPQKALTFVLRKYEALVSSSCVPCVSCEIGMGAQEFESSRDVWRESRRLAIQTERG